MKKILKSVMLNMSIELHKKLKESATVNCRTLASEIMFRLKESFKK